MKKSLISTLFVLAAALIFVACGEKNNESASNNDFMGLEWSNQIGEDMLRKGAENYCKKLKDGGHNDWRLPNIDELRTLIKNHPGTQTGGTCKISKKAGKLSGEEWTTDCNGKDGINFSKLGATGIFWSSSVVSNDSTSNWAVNFDNGTIYSKDEGIGSAHCVRDAKENLQSTKAGDLLWSETAIKTKSEVDAQTAKTDVAQAKAETEEAKTEAKKQPTQPITAVQKSSGGTRIGNLEWSDRSSNEMTWSIAKGYCAKLNEGGHSDWRLPNIDELRTLLITDRVSSRCKVSERNNCLSLQDCWSCSSCVAKGVRYSDSRKCKDWGTYYADGRYSKLGDGNVWLWSSSILSFNNDHAWGVNFGGGFVYGYYMAGGGGNVRCVRGENNQTTSQKTVPQRTTFEWSKRSRTDMKWSQAVNYCKNLNENGYSDWRLPTISELRTLIEHCPETQTGGKCSVTDNCLSYKDCRNTPCKGCDYPLNGQYYSRLGDTERLWSSSVISDRPDKAWNVHFYFGYVDDISKGYDDYVRCVRGQNPPKPEENIKESAKQTKTKCKFSIQLSATQSKDEAIEEAEQYKPMKIRIIEAVVNGTTWYRLRTGCFASREEANEALPEIKDIVEDAMIMPE